MEQMIKPVGPMQEASMRPLTTKELASIKKVTDEAKRFITKILGVEVDGSLEDNLKVPEIYRELMDGNKPVDETMKLAILIAYYFTQLVVDNMYGKWSRAKFERLDGSKEELDFVLFTDQDALAMFIPEFAGRQFLGLAALRYASEDFE